MKKLDYGKDYRYAHDYTGNFVEMEFLPKPLEGVKFFEPQSNPREEEMRKFLQARWKNKYGY